MSSTTTRSPAISHGRPLDAGASALIVMMCLLWGLNQVAIKFAMPEIPPFMQATLRSSGGLLIVLVWVRLRGITLMARDGTLLPGLVAGALFGLEFVLIYRGLLFTNASRATLFLYTAPFFVALGARWLLPGERPGIAQWLGLGLCFAGLATAMGVPQASVDARMLFGDALLIGGGAMWAATTLTIKATRLSAAPPEKTLVYQLMVSVPILSFSSVAFGESIAHTPGPLAASWLAYQILVVGFTFPVWFTFLQRYSATRVSAFTILAPLFGVVAGCLLLGEPFTFAFAVAVVLVISGLLLVNRSR